MNPGSSWWRRNRLWLALLLPLLLLAVVASSFRMVRLYLPWEWSRPLVAHGNSGVLRQDFLGFDDRTYQREVRVAALSAVSQREYGKAQAAPGAILWRVLLEFEAAPDQLLPMCTVEIEDAAGTRYGHRGGMVSIDDPSSAASTPLFQECTPEASPGPKLEPVTGKWVPSPVERPRTWRLDFVFATPEQVEPTRVRVGWDMPEYLVLDLP